MRKRILTLKETIQESYLDYINNYLTLGTYAEHKGLTYDEAEDLIRMGRKLHERIVEENKQYFRDNFEIIHIEETKNVKQQCFCGP
jgi:Pyruvate/2-oxoacid:ferredoxin oxidoreductase gamma subunit